MDLALFAEILETIMIVSFGVSWPISIAKSLKSKTSAGKSPLFISMIIFGYICGIISKIIAGNYNLAFYFYWINFATTSFDLALNLYYRNKEKKALEAK